MRCPTLAELPVSPNKTGWPWTEEAPQLPQTMSDGSSWPRVSIVTPSFNQAQFIEETIRSVLLQGYPALEYIIIDGGSTDGSVEIIRKYAPWLAYWVSEPDRGQLDAITKGLVHSSGEIIAYLNSDDTYLPGTFVRVIQAFQAHRDAAAICGGELLIDRDGMVIAEHRVQSATWYDLATCHFIPQPAVFLRRAALEQAGGFDPRFQIIFDFELWTRVAQIAKIACIPDILATTRWHASSRTLTQRIKVGSELQRLFREILNSPAGHRLSFSERRFVQARLNLVLSDIYLDNLPGDLWKAIFSMFSVILNWPPLSVSLARGLFYRFRMFLKAANNPQATLNPTLRQGHIGRHWSTWRSAGM